MASSGEVALSSRVCDRVLVAASGGGIAPYVCEGASLGAATGEGGVVAAEVQLSVATAGDRDFDPVKSGQLECECAGHVDGGSAEHTCDQWRRAEATGHWYRRGVESRGGCVCV